MRPSPIPREAGTCAARDVAGGSGHATVVRPAGGRQGHEGGPRIPGTGRVQGAGCTGARPGACSLRPGDGRVRARTGGRRGAEGAQRPRRRHGARRVVRRCVPAGFVPEIGRADGLRRRVRPRRARHGAGEAGVLRARRPRRPPRRGLAAPAYARLPCPRARMASQEVSEHVEHVDDPLLTAHRTLPLVSERTGRHAQGRVAVQSSLPLGIERAVSVRSGSSGSASGTFRVEWQCVSHCHSVVSVLSGAPYTATRRRACRIGTIRGEWQCVRYAQRRVAVLAGTDSGPAAVTPIGEWPNWTNALGRPPPRQARRGVAPRPAGLGLGLTARKGAVWAEGLADGAPWAKPRHHQAASCGLRRCRELRLRQGPGV